MFCEFASDKPTLFSCNLKYIFWLCFINLETKALLIWRKVGGPQGALPPEPTLPHIYMEKIGTQGVHVSTACVCRGIEMPCGFNKRLC